MNDDDDRWLGRVRALLAKAEDPAATPEEAESYTSKATELIAKFGIDKALLAAKESTREQVGDRVVIVHAPYAMNKMRFLNAIAEALGAKGIRLTGAARKNPAKGTEELHLFGMEADLVRIDLLFTSLLVQSAQAMSYAYDRDPQAWDRSRQWRYEFIEGFTSVISQRLQEAEHRAQSQAQEEQHQTDAGGPSVALVLASRKDRVAERISEAYPTMRPARPTRFKVGTGYGAGRAAGERADLGGGTGIRSGRSRALAS